jgi:hypothetical protein
MPYRPKNPAVYRLFLHTNKIIDGIRKIKIAIDFLSRNVNRFAVFYMILFHVPASRIRAIRRHQQTNRMNPTTPTIPAKIVNAVILSTLPTKISIIPLENFME